MDIFDTLNSNFHENLCKCQINVNKSQINSIVNGVNEINLNPVLTPRWVLNILLFLLGYLNVKQEFLWNTYQEIEGNTLPKTWNIRKQLKIVGNTLKYHKILGNIRKYQMTNFYVFPLLEILTIFFSHVLPLAQKSVAYFLGEILEFKGASRLVLALKVFVRHQTTMASWWESPKASDNFCCGGYSSKLLNPCFWVHTRFQRSDSK
jgi:hypothetical protein